VQERGKRLGGLATAARLTRSLILGLRVVAELLDALVREFRHAIGMFERSKASPFFAFTLISAFCIAEGEPGALRLAQIIIAFPNELSVSLIQKGVRFCEVSAGALI